MKSLTVFAAIFCLGILNPVAAQHSVARLWNEQLLEAIREDLARPTVHARNLFHTSIAMYDGWAVYDEGAEPYLLGKTVDRLTVPFEGISQPEDLQEARKETISYAAYRLLSHRFRESPGAAASLARFNSLMSDLGYNTAFTSTNYSSGSPAALGNYIAEKIIEYGMQDGSNEQNGYANRFYKPVNPPLVPELAGNQQVTDPNRWQPLSFEVFVDQAGNIIEGNTPEFLGAEWGQVDNFALSNADLLFFERDEYAYWVYHDPGPPPFLQDGADGEESSSYKWSFALVSAWSSHLDPSDGVMWDISPASIGNIQQFPASSEKYGAFYNFFEGGDIGTGRDRNPHTGEPYEPQLVPRGDYTRVLAEFWADGPNSETPPGHWFTILNYVNDHPLLEKRYKGTGPELNDLEWDVKVYFVLGGAVHDAAVSAWGIKGWYDYVRPISAIRYMAGLGQSSDPDLPSYHPQGMPLIEGLIELVEEDDALAVENEGNIGKIKIFAWRGHSHIDNQETDMAGVGWILAENWWPYQQPTFITPPFAGYISGHSTFSRAAAEVLTLFTGDAYFPGGMGEFVAKKNEFLEFEQGPSQDIILQWATYRDASDQTSLSRIWGGIHPPSDDMPGRKIGQKVGIAAFEKADRYFNGKVESGDGKMPLTTAYPNPVQSGDPITIDFVDPVTGVTIQLYNILGQQVRTRRLSFIKNQTTFDTHALASGFYIIRIMGEDL
ncbi:MAG: T9SS type A sorting domain-containing protein [Balneolaceae bacterium]|nr:T9SS type A sorting domain-containing protein [Balneolaceae bacterium]